MTDGPVTKLGVAGYPISHSLSPRIHNDWIKRHGLNAHYDAYAVQPHELADFLRSLPGKGFAGVNLTIPHKETALAIVDEIDPTARDIGAINTVIVRGGKLMGYNTDAYGFIENLRSAGIDIKGGHALILGAGGAARAVCAGLLYEGCRVTLVNRTRSKAESLASNFGGNIAVTGWEQLEKSLEGTSLLVNTTSLGMKGQPPLDIMLSTLPKDAVVTDIVYNPLITPLLAQAQAQGYRIVDGLGMLLYQAQLAFKLWFGVLPEVDTSLRARVLEALA